MVSCYEVFAEIHFKNKKIKPGKYIKDLLKKSYFYHKLIEMNTEGSIANLHFIFQAGRKMTNPKDSLTFSMGDEAFVKSFMAVEVLNKERQKFGIDNS